MRLRSAQVAEQTPLTAARYGELALEAGIPPGVLNIIQCASCPELAAWTPWSVGLPGQLARADQPGLQTPLI